MKHIEKYEFGRIFNVEERKKTHSSSTHHMPYPLFKNILFHEMHPWTEVLLPSILHICCDQEWQLFSVCCHVQDHAGAQLQNQSKPLLMYSFPTYGQYLYNIHHWKGIVEQIKRRCKMGGCVDSILFVATNLHKGRCKNFLKIGRHHIRVAPSLIRDARLWLLFKW